MALPQFFALHTTYEEISKYVRFINEDVPHRRFLSISGLDVVSPFTRFEVVESKSSRDDGLVNIRCCYNHKYWVKSEDSNKIVAGADEPEEDQSKWSCTLFEPIYNGDKIVKFRHAYLNYYVYFEVAAPPEESWLYLKKEMPGTPYCDEFIVTDLVSMMILPKYVVLKGHEDTFLSPRMIENHQFMKFAVDEPTVHEVCTTHDGSVYLKNQDGSGIWKRNSDWILVDSDNGQYIDPDMFFWPTKVTLIGSWLIQVALRNLGNNRFCIRVNDFTSRLSPVDHDISYLAHIEVEEPVTSRRIDDFKYLLRDSWIYNRTPFVIATEVVDNNSQYPIKRVVKISCRDIRTSCWNSSASLKLESVPTTLDTAVPFIDENGNIIVPVEIHTPFPYKWGETITTSETAMEKVDEVTVKPMSKMTVKLIATQASFDVPFSYSQLDTLINGKKVPYSLEDGVYTGTNRYNYRFETQEENL